MVRGVEDNEFIPRVHRPGDNNAQVTARPAARGESLHPARHTHPPGKRSARGARYGDLKLRGANAETLVHNGILPRNTAGGEVFTEGALNKRKTELTFPLVKFLAGEGIDRLVGTTVVRGVTDGISHNTWPITVAGARSKQLERIDWDFVDAADARRTAGILAGNPLIAGQYVCHGAILTAVSQWDHEF